MKKRLNLRWRWQFNGGKHCTGCTQLVHRILVIWPDFFGVVATVDNVIMKTEIIPPKKELCKFINRTIEMFWKSPNIFYQINIWGIIGNLFSCFYLRWGIYRKYCSFFYKILLLSYLWTLKKTIYTTTEVFIFLSHKHCH